MYDIKAFSSFSEPFASPLFPKKGELVTLSIVFSEKPDSVILRADGNTGLVYSYQMREKGRLNGAYLYSAEAEIPLSDEIFRYFFVFSYHGTYLYYAKNGIQRNCPKRADRFSVIPSLDAPDWVAGSTCYQIFPDRFAKGDMSVGAKEGEYEFDGGMVTTPDVKSEPKPFEQSRCLDFYNGDLRGIEDKADYLLALGVNAIYLNPINNARTVHRYDAIDFFNVDPHLGGNEAFSSLIRTMHEKGIRVILDISINHTGSDCPWIRKAIEDPDSDEAGFYYLENGRPRFWQGVETLLQLNYRSNRLRDIIYRNPDSAMQKFIRPPFGIDGWRLDVAPEVGRAGADQLCRDVWKEVRKSLKGIKHDLYLVGEDWDDSTEYMQGDMWDATMNYYGVSRILRSWMGECDRFLSSGWGHDPGRTQPFTGDEMEKALSDAVCSVPDQAAYFQMNLIDSHDTPRLHCNQRVMNREIYKGAVMCMYLLPGMPSVYYGDEVQIKGRMGSVEGARYPMDWTEESWDRDMLAFYSKLGDVRKLPFLPYSAFSVEAIDSEAFAIKRIGSGYALIAFINRCPRSRTVSADLFAMPSNVARGIFSSHNAGIEGRTISVKLEAYESALFLLSERDGGSDLVIS